MITGLIVTIVLLILNAFIVAEFSLVRLRRSLWTIRSGDQGSTGIARNG